MNGKGCLSGQKRYWKPANNPKALPEFFKDPPSFKAALHFLCPLLSHLSTSGSAAK